MLNFNIVHVFPLGNNGPAAYNEVIETVTWGLEQLGNLVTYEKFIYSADIVEIDTFKLVIKNNAINIIFGAQILHLPFLEILPKNTVIYNLEQRLDFLNMKVVPEEYIYQAKKFIIWDYSEKNISAWKFIYPEALACHVKIGYAPILKKINTAVNPDIDVLIYGSPTAGRFRIFSDVAALGLRVVFMVGVFDRTRDELISRSKVILNLHHELYNKVFEIVRVSYLLANSKAVVSELTSDTVLEDELCNSILFSPTDQIAKYCYLLVQNEAYRREIEWSGRIAMESCDIREILSKAMIYNNP